MLITLNDKIVARTQNHKYKLNSLEAHFIDETLFNSFVVLIFTYSD